MIYQAAIAGLLAVHVQAHPKPFDFVRDGRAVAGIVVPRNNAVDLRAAKILRSSIAKMSGASLEIGYVPRAHQREILIDFPLPKKYTEYQAFVRPDGFSVVHDGDKIYVYSGGNKGAIYGVTTLLEKYLGCRYFSPRVQVFPKSRTVSTAKDFYVGENPANSFRCVNGEFNADQDYMDWRRLSQISDMFGTGYYVHTFRKLVPPEEYFAKHPEYFALVEGKRVADQLCPSDPHNVDIIVSNLRTEMAKQPDKKVWSVSQNDNEGYCQCDRCKRIIAEEGSPSGPILRLVNAVAARFPDKTISTLAYLYSRHAPQITKPAPNVQIMLCTIELNRGQAIAADPASKDFVKDITDWGKIARNIYLWDYTVNFNHHISPFPNLHTLHANIRFFHENGVRNMFQQTNTGNGHEFTELKAYIEAKLLWDPDADVEVVRDDFLKGYYGAAAPFIREYIVKLKETLIKSGTRLDIYERPNAHARDYLSAENMAVYNRLFDQAEAVVSKQSDVLERVRTARLPIRYAALEIGLGDMFGRRGFFTGDPPKVRPSMRNELENFLKTSVKNQVHTVSEIGLSPVAFHDGIAKMLQIQSKGNLAFRRPVTSVPAPSKKYGNGDASLLTNGIRGADDFGIQWLGWEGDDCELTVDLGPGKNSSEVEFETLSVPTSWILTPKQIDCLVSTEGRDFQLVGRIDGDISEHQTTGVSIHKFYWKAPGVRYVKLQVTGVDRLPAWHSYTGRRSWTFIDEIVVR